LLLPCLADPRWASAIVRSLPGSAVAGTVAVIVAVLDPDASETLASLEVRLILAGWILMTLTPTVRLRLAVSYFASLLAALTVIVASASAKLPASSTPVTVTVR